MNTGSVTSILEGGRVHRGIPGTEQGPTGVSTNVVSRLHFREFNSTLNQLAAEIGKIRQSLKKMDGAYKDSTELNIPIHNALVVGTFEIPKPSSEVVADVYEIYCIPTADGSRSKIAGTLCIKVTAVGGEVNYPKGLVRSESVKISLVVISIILMLAVHILSLLSNGWLVTLGWVFMVVGYLGLLISVGLYAEAIRRRVKTTNVQLGPHTPVPNSYCALQNGNLDQEGQSGYALPVRKLGGMDVVKMSNLRHPSFLSRLLGTFTGASLLVSFLLHYLGLRSVQWWVSIGELVICFFMIALRTAVVLNPVDFQRTDASFDCDLRSIGVIRPNARKRANITEQLSHSYTWFSDVRLFVGIRRMGVKTEGDIVAALVASKLINMSPILRRRVFGLIGLSECQIKKTGNSRFVIIHCGGTGLLTKEGFLRPLKPLVWATEFTLDQMKTESLIGFVIHGMNRNEDLELLSQFKDFTNEAVFIPAANSVVDWWLRSEGSNDWEFNARNLQWSGALALALLLCKLATDEGLDKEVQICLHNLFQSAISNPPIVTKIVANDFSQSLEELANHEICLQDGIFSFAPTDKLKQIY